MLVFFHLNVKTACLFILKFVINIYQFQYKLVLLVQNYHKNNKYFASNFNIFLYILYPFTIFLRNCPFFLEKFLKMPTQVLKDRQKILLGGGPAWPLGLTKNTFVWGNPTDPLENVRLVLLIFFYFFIFIFYLFFLMTI